MLFCQRLRQKHRRPGPRLDQKDYAGGLSMAGWRGRPVAPLTPFPPWPLCVGWQRSLGRAAGFVVRSEPAAGSSHPGTRRCATIVPTASPSPQRQFSN
jgi:hypothetical protein